MHGIKGGDSCLQKWNLTLFFEKWWVLIFYVKVIYTQ